MSGEKITCQVCTKEVHAIAKHLKDDHANDGWTLEKYKQEFPNSPLLSEIAESRARELARQRAAVQPPAAPESKSAVSSSAPVQQFLHEVFGLGNAQAAMSAKGAPIPIVVLPEVEGEFGAHMIPQVERTYVFNIDVLRNVLMCLQNRMACYLWGHMGTGKTTMFEQVCARTKRPAIRVNHTVNTEEPHILGQYVLRNGHTEFQPGWLPLAVKFGLVYIADEYDFAVPQVLSVYQSVLEGKALVIKDAPPEWRIVQPHENFRFCATGNTNGTGDSTNIYQGTQIQNAANYERFAVVQRVDFMEPALESKILQGSAGVPASAANDLVKFAGLVRDQVSKGQISLPITPRSLLNAAKLGIAKANYKVGLELAYLNRLSDAEREAGVQIAQRVFG